MKIQKGKKYKIVNESEHSKVYFKGKYGEEHPIIVIEDHHENLWTGGWMFQDGNPACMMFGMRAGLSGIKNHFDVWYGKIGNLGELVAKEELEEIK